MTSPVTPTEFYSAAGTENWLVNASAETGNSGLVATATFRTGSFGRGADLVAHINDLANAANHHPDIELTYPTVSVRLTTHDAGSTVTDADIALAQQISRAAADLGIAIAPVRTPVQPELLESVSSRRLGTLATIGIDGRPQVSTVLFHYSRGIIRASLTDTRVKVRNMRRDPRVTMHIVGADGFSWVAAEGIAQLGPMTTAPADSAAEDLVDLYRAVSGEHEDWNEFRAAMVAEQRLVLRLIITRTYGNA